MTDEFPALDFVDQPPPSNRGNERLYVWFAKQLRANPGRWARLPLANKAGISTAIGQGKMSAFRPAGHFEAVYRKDLDSDDKWNYVRYIGPVDDEPTSNGVSAKPAPDLQRERNPDRAARIDQMVGNK